MTNINRAVKCYKFVLTDHIVKIALANNLSTRDLLVLIFLDNNYSPTFDPTLISKVLTISETEALEAFNNLMQKKLITLKATKDSEGRMNEEVDLSGIYNQIEEEIITTTKEEEKESIYSIFAKELGHQLTGMEVEIVNAWLEKGYTEEIILGALKEAIYNGVPNLRYIDKILYEWGKKKFKTMNDVKNHEEKRREENVQQELFDYDWINDYE